MEGADHSRRKGRLEAAFSCPTAITQPWLRLRSPGRRHKAVVAIDGAAADDGRHDAALHRTLVERRVLGLAPQFVAVDLPGVVGVEHHEIGWRAFCPAG